MTKKIQRHKKFEDFLQEELQDPEVAMGYLNEALADEDPHIFLIALKDVINAQQKDMTEIAKKAHLNRQNLYRMLSKKGNPRWENLNSLFDTLGYQVQLSPKK